MYTDDMQRAFRSITPPKNFRLQIIDNEHFLTVKASEKDFLNLYHDDKIEAFQYMLKVKQALEENGAIVLLVRDGGK
jgi:hypothetical protein